MFFGEQASYKEKNKTRMNAALAFLGQRALWAAEGLRIRFIIHSIPLFNIDL